MRSYEYGNQAGIFSLSKIISPSDSSIILSHFSATERSWVTITTVLPFLLRLMRTFIISFAVFLSSAAVGSSASIIFGRLTMALASAHAVSDLRKALLRAFSEDRIQAYLPPPWLSAFSSFCILRQG